MLIAIKRWETSKAFFLHSHFPSLHLLSFLSLSVTRPRSSLLLTSLISPYLCSQSHWDNCAPIMEKLVGPEMSSSLSLSALREAERRRSAHSATSNPDELQRRRRKRRKDHRCEASSTNQLSLCSFLSSSSLRCFCFSLEYHFNVTLQVFYYFAKIKWNKKRCGCCRLKKVACLGSLIGPWKGPYQTCWVVWLTLQCDCSFKKGF